MCFICIRMWHSRLNDMEISETKRFIPKGFELGTIHWVQVSRLGLSQKSRHETKLSLLLKEKMKDASEKKTITRCKMRYHQGYSYQNFTYKAS